MNTTWSSTTRILVIVIILLGAIWLAVVANPLFEALVISALLAYLLDPVVRLLMCRAHLNRPLAAVCVYVLFLLILAGIPTVLGVVTVGQFHRLETEFVTAVDALKRWLFRPVTVLGYPLRPRVLLDNLEQSVSSALAALPSGSFGLLSDVTTNLLWGLVSLVSLYYFLKDGPKIKPWLVGLAPPAYQDEIQRLMDEIDHVWRIFLRVQLFIFVVLTVLIAVGTLLVIWLFRAGLLPWSPLVFVLLLVLVYTAAQQVDNLWLRPQLMGRQLRLHPGLVFVGLTGALALSGVLGTFVVVPCMATAKVVGRYVHRKLLGLPPWPAEARATASQEKREDAFADQPNEKPDLTGRVRKRMLQVVIQMLLIAAILFVASGRLDWVWAWAYLGVGVGIVVINALVLPPELIAEREQIKEDTKRWDRVLSILLITPTLGTLIVAGLDKRFGWSPQLTVATQVVALIVFALAQGLFTWAMASNKFFSGTVRIQKERGHAVATGGPYRYVRHPGYVGYIISWLATSLTLGSLWALIPAGLVVSLMIVRTSLEDKTLLEELDGYQEYARQVRYRLLPGIW